MKKMSKNSKSTQSIFSTRSYPTFGGKGKIFDEQKPPKGVIKSPYYWWFMFLRLNADYKATCAAKGVGKCSEIYKDLGDVYSVNFKEWWVAKSHLFAESKKGYSMKIATRSEELAPFNNAEVVNLVVPLTWSRRSLQKSFTTHVLNKVEKGKRGVSVENSDAKYKIGSKWHIEAFKYAYDVYLEKQRSLSQGEKVYWADIGIRARLPLARVENAKEGVTNRKTVHVRAMLTILANRHYQRAERFIKNSATKSFPK